MKKYLLFLPLLAAASMTIDAKVTPGSMITDNMVLQQNGKAHIYGKADPNKTVTVTPSWSNTPYKTKSGADGKWSVKIDTPAGSYTPYSITISDGTPITINNVLVGEVWLASGQSNMEMPLKGFPGCCVAGGYDEVATSREKADKIRFYTVPLTQSYEPVETIDAAWTVPGPDTSAEYSATGWYFAKRLNEVLDVPVGVVRCAYGGARVESWTPREILETYSDVSLDPADIDKMTHYLRPLLMYNAMFNPAKEFTYDGIIWYQGCSNVGEDANYATRLATMVDHWRKQLGEGDIPFYQVEIAPYEYDSPEQDGKSPLLREAQWKAAEIIPNAGIICTNDLVQPFERYNIHPADKASVGKRLAELALAKTYGNKTFPVISPKYKSHRVDGNAMRVAIDSPSDGICRNYAIEGFEIAGPDRVFHPADSVTLDWRTNEFIVSSKDVQEPVAVRYGWADFLPGNVHAGNYLPLVPFRTDNWPVQ